MVHIDMDTACIFNIQRFSIHDGPGIRTAIFFQGCPLRCQWCCNPESHLPGIQPQYGELQASPYTLEELVQLCLEDRDFYEESGGGVTLTGGEVLMQAEFATNLIMALKEKGVHTAIETSGHAAQDVFLRACSVADLLLFDLKHYNSDKHREGTWEGNELIMSNLQRAVNEKMEILIRIPVIPGYNDSGEDAKGFAKLIKEMGLDRAQLLPFHQFGQKKYTNLGLPYLYDSNKSLFPEDLLDYKQIMDNCGIDGFF